MSVVFDSLETSLQQALAYAGGDVAGCVVHEVEVPDTDLAALRARTGLSQAAFARSIGVKKATLLNWEQGRRVPDGPARVLLALIAKEPGIVQRVLG
jgi:putative transcriptional regulator